MRHGMDECSKCGVMIASSYEGKEPFVCAVCQRRLTAEWRRRMLANETRWLQGG